MIPPPEQITAAPQPKRVLIETWGCQMNVADSEEMLGLLARESYVLTDDPTQADLILLNTCHIREKARHKVVSRLGELRAIKAERPGLKIAVAGCVAQAEGERLMKEAPVIDLLLGPGRIKDLPRLLNDHAASGLKQVARGFDRHDDVTPVANPTLTGRAEISRFISITQGCDNFCTFCVVPFTRGREVSRPTAAILGEARALLATGARELSLLGQNVNSYGQDLVASGAAPATADGPFVDLLREVLALDGLARLRFTTSNPHDFTPALANLFATHPRMGSYLHLPVQSGSDRVLERMKRKVTRAEYEERITWLRAIDPELAISTDIIVGFPGETEDDFAATLALVEAARFSFIFSFKYSTRKGTAAARFRDQIPEDLKEARLARLNALQNSITTAQNLAEIGRDRTVLVQYESRKEPGIYYGRSEQFRLVRIPSSQDLVGQLVPVRITTANRTALVGSVTL